MAYKKEEIYNLSFTANLTKEEFDVIMIDNNQISKIHKIKRFPRKLKKELRKITQGINRISFRNYMTIYLYLMYKHYPIVWHYVGDDVNWDIINK